MREIDLAYRTMFAELGQRSLDAAFKTEFPPEGRFVAVPVRGRSYRYFDPPAQSGLKRTYVGPRGDSEITRRVEAFDEIKNDLRARRKLVSTLTREAGLPVPERFTGKIVHALAHVGLFRLRGVLVGTVAFQCYPGMLGVRFPSTTLQTADADFAQFHSVLAAVDDTLPPMLDVLRKVDTSFREVPHQTDGRQSTKFVNASRYEVEFLTPNRGSSDHDGKPAAMPALGGAAAALPRLPDLRACPLRPAAQVRRQRDRTSAGAVRRTQAHRGPPAPRRSNGPPQARQGRDAGSISRAGSLSDPPRRRSRDRHAEAWNRGPAWRETLLGGLGTVPAKMRAAVTEGLAEGLREVGENPGVYGFEEKASPGQ